MNALSSDEQDRKMDVPLHVLIVEDSKNDFLLLMEELRNGGYDPVCERVETGEAMSAALDRETWDAILIEYTLPRFSGNAALDLIKHKHIDLPTIIVSETINDEAAVMAMKAGAHDYITKNNLKRLIPAIERELREAKERQERRRLEKALQENEKKFFALFQHSPVPMAITSIEEGRLVDVNEQYTRLMGFSREELIGHTTAELNLWVDSGERKRYIQSIEKNQGRIQSYPVSARTKSGNVIEVLFSADIIKINDAPYLISSAVDITERLKAEETLKTQAHVLDRMAEGVNLTDENGFITFTNPAYDAIFGYEPGELIGKHVSILNVGSSADNIRLSNEIIQELKTTGTWSGEFDNRKKGGTPLTTHAYISAMEVSGKQFWVTVQEDITARKKAEIRLARLNDCFLQFGVSPDDNINRLVAVCGELMNATAALYNRLGKNLLCSVGQWQTPADVKSEDKPDGHICYDVLQYDVLQHGGNHPLLVRNLQESPYARTDPNILSYGLQTYLGMAVKWKQAAVGSLCVVYQTDIIPSSDDLQFMTIIASAIAVEEARQRTEESLRAAEENFRHSLDNSPLGVRIATIEGETIYVNRAILDSFGYDSSEELRTTPLKEIYTPESYTESKIRKEKRKQGTNVPSNYEVSIVRKNGEVRHLQVLRKLTLWGGEQQFQVIYQDITERKQAENELWRSREQLRALAGRLQATREEERTQIAREIHDEFGGALTAMKIDSSLLARTAATVYDKALRDSLKARIDAMTKLIDATMRTVRRIATGLRPGVLDDLGLPAALEWQVIDFQKRTGIRCEFTSSGESDGLDGIPATALFRIAQEALTNVARHAQATEVRVHLQVDASAILLKVEDNGVGIKKEEIRNVASLGILGMQERALSFGGRVTITGRPGEGTTVAVESPPVEKREIEREADG